MCDTKTKRSTDRLEITARVLHMSKSGGGARLPALGGCLLAHALSWVILHLDSEK